MRIDENYGGNPKKTASLAKADTQLKAGDKAGALQTLGLVAINVSFSLEVAPLGRSITLVNDAENLADAGEYFEANPALKHAQDNIRFDVQTVWAVPDNARQAIRPMQTVPPPRPVQDALDLKQAVRRISSIKNLDFIENKKSRKGMMQGGC